MIKRWFQEPLLHFLLAGALLFAAYVCLHRDRQEGDRVVHISAAEVDWLKETWTRQQQREPDEAELRGLVADYLRESLFAREATELGLDQDDFIVRRRLAQKMDFLIRDTASLAEPEDQALRQLYATDRERYRTPALVTFEQVYFHTESDARRILAGAADGRVPGAGAPTFLEHEYIRSDSQQVAAAFGPGFAGRVFALEPGTWQGPVESGYGFHLVRVTEHERARPLSFDDVRARLVEEWHRQEQARTTQLFLDELMKKYDVVVDESLQPLIGPLAGTTP